MHACFKALGAFRGDPPGLPYPGTPWAAAFDMRLNASRGRMEAAVNRMVARLLREAGFLGNLRADASLSPPAGGRDVA